MQNFCIAYRGILSKHELYATGTTGRLIEEVTNLTLHKYLPGHLGGSQQLGAQIEHNQIDLLIFLRDPLAPKPHEPDVNDVVRLCDIHNIPMATNLATAELLVKALDRGDMEWREMYKMRKQTIGLAGALMLCGISMLTGCGARGLEQAYSFQERETQMTPAAGAGLAPFFASSLCVPESADGDIAPDDAVNGAGGRIV